MSVTCVFEGRLGNIVFNIGMLIGYCKRHGLKYHIPTFARSCTFGVSSITVPSTGEAPVAPDSYWEPVDAGGHPYFHEIPGRDNVLFRGWYQSFKYFDAYRQDVLTAFDLPWVLQRGIVSLSVRRGDCVAQPDAFPLAPPIYYHKAVAYMVERGYRVFRVFSDDAPWCRGEFTVRNYPGAQFEFSELQEPRADFVALSQCEHHILARSTFSMTGAWMNRNPQKIVLCPEYFWRGQNRDLLPPYFTRITWTPEESKCL